MSQAEKPNSTTLSRRSALAGLSVAAAAAAGAIDIPAGAVEINAVIAAHREAVEHEVACHVAGSAMEKIVPDDRQTWHLYIGHSETLPDGCADAPEWIASQLAILAAYNRRDEAIDALLTTAPTTLAGTLDLLEHLGSPEFPGSHESRMSVIYRPRAF